MPDIISRPTGSTPHSVKDHNQPQEPNSADTGVGLDSLPSDLIELLWSQCYDKAAFASLAVTHKQLLHSPIGPNSSVARQNKAWNRWRENLVLFKTKVLLLDEQAGVQRGELKNPDPRNQAHNKMVHATAGMESQSKGDVFQITQLDNKLRVAEKQVFKEIGKLFLTQVKAGEEVLSSDDEGEALGQVIVEQNAPEEDTLAPAHDDNQRPQELVAAAEPQDTMHLAGHSGQPAINPPRANHEEDRPITLSIAVSDSEPNNVKILLQLKKLDDGIAIPSTDEQAASLAEPSMKPRANVIVRNGAATLSETTLPQGSLHHTTGIQSNTLTAPEVSKPTTTRSQENRLNKQSARKTFLISTGIVALPIASMVLVITTSDALSKQMVNSAKRDKLARTINHSGLELSNGGLLMAE